jgi:hypothetical protein
MQIQFIENSCGTDDYSQEVRLVTGELVARYEYGQIVTVYLENANKVGTADLLSALQSMWKDASTVMDNGLFITFEESAPTDDDPSIYA